MCTLVLLSMILCGLWEAAAVEFQDKRGRSKDRINLVRREEIAQAHSSVQLLQTHGATAPGSSKKHLPCEWKRGGRKEKKWAFVFSGILSKKDCLKKVNAQCLSASGAMYDKIKYKCSCLWGGVSTNLADYGTVSICKFEAPRGRECASGSWKPATINGGTSKVLKKAKSAEDCIKMVKDNQKQKKQCKDAEIAIFSRGKERYCSCGIGVKPTPTSSGDSAICHLKTKKKKKDS